MNLKETLQAATFGARVAEDERDTLASYFVETDQWRRLYEGSVDVVYGAKGSGKSALYFLLLSRFNELLERGIVIVAAENPQGAPAFKDLVRDPPTSEDEFRALWKLYMLALVAEEIRERGIANQYAHRLVDALEAAGLVEPKASLSRRISAVLAYVRKALPPDSVEGGIAVIDPGT
ncbi:MAG: P-loop ATPase, Sll1717 family, partial [Dehalococcoidia bacterium]